MNTTWVPDGTGVQRDGWMSDTQVTEKSYSVRFWREEDGTEGRLVDGERLFSMVTLYFYGETRMEDEYDASGIAKDSEGEPIVWLTTQTETMVCTSRDDPGSTERWCDYQYDQSAECYKSREAVDAFARKRAENYTAELANRDIGWNGIAPWETTLYDELREVTQRAIAALEPDGMDMQEWAKHAGRAAEIHEEIARRLGWRVAPEQTTRRSTTTADVSEGDD